MRVSNIGLIAVALGAIACEPAPDPFTSDVFWVEFTEVGEPCAPREITENFNIAAPPTAPDAPESTMSIPGRYISVSLAENGTALVNIDGDVLVGQVRPNGSVEATFLNEELLDETREAETYLHTRIEEDVFEQTITIVPNNNEENPRVTGTLTRRERFLFEVTETDEWDPEVVGTLATQMPETDDFLEWTEFVNSNVINQEFIDDCPEDTCSLRVSEDCTQEFDIAGVRLDGADLGDFDVLDGFDQPEGVE